MSVLRITERWQIPDDEFEFTFSRSSGPGGQNVNKVETAVRITHIPTGLVVASQAQRSQHQNRATAMNMLRSRLLELEIQRREEEAARERGETMTIGFGHGISVTPLHVVRATAAVAYNGILVRPTILARDADAPLPEAPDPEAVRALERLAIHLEAVPQLLQQSGHRHVADRMPALLKRVGNVQCATR